MIKVQKDYSFVYKRTEYNVVISYTDTQNYNLYHGNMQDDL